MKGNHSGLDPSFAWQELFSYSMDDRECQPIGTLSAQMKWVGVDAIGVRLVLVSPDKRYTDIIGEGFIDL